MVLKYEKKQNLSAERGAGKRPHSTFNHSTIQPFNQLTI
ncbi:hypothetical protein Cabys_2675 [Caldithrix abyssi DSM 13497]|uniref:Uncharacterized protein n=1 Tax=Caldithrix abyssi DSM 13497 TaxID=880073 RepID=A0A1J1C9T3_CALAY|nr:hypothetical protein Cabys_2675 [Caldithrix abyssi DSM 13497]